MKSTPHAPSSTSGFTMAELLVAMVIFLILMSGVLVMFGATIAGVNETYARKDTFETGRAALDVIARDLQAAFTAREHGDLYNFYGTPNGFMFVGALQDGHLGRITYAFRQSGELAEFGVDPAQGSDLDGDGIQDTDRQEFRPVYWLIRYEEPGRTNLDDFDLPGTVQWPKIHPLYSLQDRNLTPAAENGAPDLEQELLRVLRGNDGTDMREVIHALRYNRSEGLHVIDEDFTSQLVATRKRDLWIDMVAGTGIFTNLLAPQPGTNLNNDYFARILAEKGHELVDYAIAENVLAPKMTDANGMTVYASNIPDANGYWHPNTLPFLTYAGADGSRLQVFNTVHNYSFPQLGDPDLAARRIIRLDDPRPGVGVRNNNMNPVVLQEFDDGLARILSGRRGNATAFGLPLLPRLPALVEPNFTVYHRPARMGGVSFEERFSQAIEVPAGLTRGLPPNLAPSPS